MSSPLIVAVPLVLGMLCLVAVLALIGLELNISILSAALRGEPTGAPVAFNADVVATAKRDLAPGEVLVQVMAAGINQAVTEALAFAEALDLPLDRVIDVVGSGAAGNWFLQHRGASMTQGKFDPGFRVALHHKDLAICKQMAEQFDTALPVVEMTLIHYRRLMEAGFGDEDISALFREKQKLFDPAATRPVRP